MPSAPWRKTQVAHFLKELFQSAASNQISSLVHVTRPLLKSDIETHRRRKALLQTVSSFMTWRPIQGDVVRHVLKTSAFQPPRWGNLWNQVEVKPQKKLPIVEHTQGRKACPQLELDLVLTVRSEIIVEYFVHVIGCGIHLIRLSLEPCSVNINETIKSKHGESN